MHAPNFSIPLKLSACAISSLLLQEPHNLLYQCGEWSSSLGMLTEYIANYIIMLIPNAILGHCNNS